MKKFKVELNKWELTTLINALSKIGRDLKENVDYSTQEYPFLYSEIEMMKNKYFHENKLMRKLMLLEYPTKFKEKDYPKNYDDLIIWQQQNLSNYYAKEAKK